MLCPSLFLCATSLSLILFRFGLDLGFFGLWVSIWLRQWMWLRIRLQPNPLRIARWHWQFPRGCFAFAPHVGGGWGGVVGGGAFLALRFPLCRGATCRRWVGRSFFGLHSGELWVRLSSFSCWSGACVCITF